MTMASQLEPTGKRSKFMLQASVGALALALASSPAAAQSLRGAISARAAARPAPMSPATAARSPTMRAAMARQLSVQSRTQRIRSYVTSAREASLAANRPPVTDGLSDNGLAPVATIREAMAAAQAGDRSRADALLVSASASRDTTGLATWEGAGLPSQTVAGGRTTVSIDQTQSRAILSWNRFDVGANTTLQFNQRANGVAQPGWVAVNRVSNSTAPSQILGRVQADGTVVVLNRRGIIFGRDSQVNTQSLLASSLELGNAVRQVPGQSRLTATTIAERNSAFLQNGLFLPPNGSPDIPALLVSTQLAAQTFENFRFPVISSEIEGGITVDFGARLSTAADGFLILTAPAIESNGVLSAIDGQVSLQAGRAVSFVESTGAPTGADPNVRGYRLNSFNYNRDDENPNSPPRDPRPDDGRILVRGLIESRRGYLSLGTGAFGSIEHEGLLSATTSVSRNAKISITAGSVTLAGNADEARASGIEMLADDSGETIPQGSADAPAGFKLPVLEIGTQIQTNAMPLGGVAPTRFTMGTNAIIYAPGARVSVGANDTAFLGLARHPGSIDIASGAVIDVSGLKGVQLDASRNQIQITPVKRNELRDTPNYREVALDGNFSLNGATLFVDPRIRGVRDDGVAWVGSPLIEAGSLASQISSGAAEFLTRGGTVSLGTSVLGAGSVTGAVDPATAPSVRIASGATIDFSGGWVNYAAGTVTTSRLVTADGRIVDIANADPNETYIAVAEGFTSIQPRFGIVRNFANFATARRQFDASYDEGRDAGRLTIASSAVAVEGTLYGNAFAGARQIALGERPSLTVAGESRPLQRAAAELPSGGALGISSQGDMLIYRGSRGSTAADLSELLLDDRMLSGAGLSALDLNAAGSVTFAGAAPATLQRAGVLAFEGATDLELAPGGALTVIAGRAIRFDGSIEAASGSITARTVGEVQNQSGRVGSLFRFGRYGAGRGDDLADLYAPGTLPTSPLDITVSGTLSVAGRWVNDALSGGLLEGGAFSDGGRISLTVSPRVFAAIGSSLNAATIAGDLSGSIRISGKLNASAGGYVAPAGELVLTGKGGDVTLRNDSVYAALYRTVPNVSGADFAGSAQNSIGGTNQSVDFTPIPESEPIGAVTPALVPEPRSVVEIVPGAIEAFGFAGGGTFTLAAPDISFGSEVRAGSTHIGFDFFDKTGFGTLDVSAYRSRIVPDIFTNARAGNSAFFETTRFTVGAGETLDLTQWLLPSILTAEQSRALRSLASGADVTKQPLLRPGKPAALWDQRAANLRLGGLIELGVLAGGSITGAPGASITTTRLYNAGAITLRGGTISQLAELPSVLLGGGLGVRDRDLGGDGLADAFGGPVDAQGRFDENAANAAGITDPANPGRLLTNRELVSRQNADRAIYFLGRLDAGQGIVLEPGSTTDLSGIALFNPRTRAQADRSTVRAGRVLDGGSMRAAASQNMGPRAHDLFPDNYPIYRNLTAPQQPQPPLQAPPVAQTLIRRDGAALDISGASAVFDQLTATRGYTPVLEWSAAGTISALGGGSLGTTPIRARGGVAQAEGGTLEWLRPTVGAGASDPAARDYLSAGLIAASGFDTLAARGSLTLDGDFSLALRRGLFVTSQPAFDANLVGADARVQISATAGTDAVLSANYVRLASRVPEAAGVFGSIPGNANVTISAAAGIDVVGGILFDRSIADVTLATPGDVRLTGVNVQAAETTPSLNGQLLAGGDLTIDAGRVYATTGTGNLQQRLEGTATSASLSYTIGVEGDHALTFGNSFVRANTVAPLSAGSHLRVLGARIVQNGYLAAPLGLLEIGSNSAVSFANSLTMAPTTSLTFGTGSVTTASGAGLTIPYGTTTDLIEYFFPTVGTPITRVPTGQLQLSGGAIVQDVGARIDARGGGDIFAFEFQSGVGGSRDVLDRINRDAFSSNDYDAATGIGYQFPDRRQVFAAVPVSQLSGIAPFDPIYSADYGDAGPVDLYGTSAGRTVRLEDAPGVAAGEYLLLPAHYALTLPGALRVVQNTSGAAPVPGTITLLDGSVIVGGSYGYAGAGIAESTRHGFTVQSRDTFAQYSRIVTTSGSTSIADQAATRGQARPVLPIDAARVILAPLTELRVAGAFDTAPGAGGRAGQFDLLGRNIAIAPTGGSVAGALTISDATLNAFNAGSLLIGGRRAEQSDGTTALSVSANRITVASGANLAAPEILLAVGGTNSSLTIADGATVLATGTLGVQPTGDYAIATADTSGQFDRTGVGSALRVANGAERLFARGTPGAGTTALEIGAATISGGALALDSSGRFAVADRATLTASQIAISGEELRFGGAPTQAGAIGASLEASLAAADRLTVRSPGAIRFSAGLHRFNDVVFDTAAIGLIEGAAPGAALTIEADEARLRNSRGAANACLTTPASCGAGASFSLATRTLALDSGAIGVSGFADTVTLAAREGITVEGEGTLTTGAAALTLRAPFLADRGAAADPRIQRTRPDYTFLTNGAFRLAGPGGALPAPTGHVAPGARIGIGTIDAPVLSATIEGALVRATAGIIDVQARGDIGVAGATLATPGFTADFGDPVDRVTVSAGGGTINLLSRTGNLRADAASRLIGDDGTGSAGRLNLLAGNGAITLEAILNPGVTGARDGSFAFDSGAGAFDLDGFVTRYGRLFGGDLAIRAGLGDLGLGAGQTIRARSVNLTTESGAVNIAGRIDTSGASIAGLSADAARDAAVNGGDIALWGAGGVSLASTAVLDSHSSGYADTDTRPASAGDVTLGIGRADAAIAIAPGARIDVGARRTEAALAAGETGARLVPQLITDEATGRALTVYRYAERDIGGTVRLRAPVIGANGDRVAIGLGGAITGADSIQVEAFRRYDLDALAATGLYSGIVRATDGTLTLNFAQSAANSSGRANPFTEAFALADGTPSMVRFIQDLDISTVDGSSLAGIRVRPGVELTSGGALATATQWNLAAASFSPAQLEAAVAAGVLVAIPELSSAATNSFYDGTTRYAVVTGREGELLERFATFAYRVGGSAAGEAPVVTLRAGGDLAINRSISDGFFTFRDRSDRAFLNYQLGGGNRTYSPAITFACGGSSANCADIQDYAVGAVTPPPADRVITISLGGTAQQGDLSSGERFVNSPLAIGANGAAGSVDASGNPNGDALGFAELFPLLSGDQAMHSSDIRLVGGAGTALSADPLRVDRARSADVRVLGEYTYRVGATGGTVRYDGPLQFNLLENDGSITINFDVAETFDATAPSPFGNTLESLRPDAYTEISWGTAAAGLSAEARAFAQQFFAGRGYRFTGPAAQPGGIIAPLGDIVAFVQAFEPTYQSGLAQNRPGYNRVTPRNQLVDYGSASSAFVRSYVRTGDGAIGIAAARDIDLRATPTPVLRETAQVGGTAIYTAGVRVAQTSVEARTVGGASASLTLDSPYLVLRPEARAFLPSPRAFTNALPVLAKGGGDVLLTAGRDVIGRRDVFSERIVIETTPLSNNADNYFGSRGLPSQRWRAGSIGVDTEIGIAPRNFTAGVGALAGGDVTIDAGRDVTELTVALDTGVTSTLADIGNTMLTFGSGNLSVDAGRDIRAGRYDIATGTGTIHADGDIVAFGLEPTQIANPQYLRVRLTDAVVDVSARGAATMASVSALGVDTNSATDNDAVGFFSAAAAFRLSANEGASLVEGPSRREGLVDENEFGAYVINRSGSIGGIEYLVHVLPPSFAMTSLTDSVSLRPNERHLLYPSPIGQLRLFGAGDIRSLVIGMSDADPVLLGGAFAPPPLDGLRYELPFVGATTSDLDLRRQHNQRVTHLGDSEPIRIHAGGDIDRSALFLPKQARITAGGDIIDMFFSGQNVAATDVTRIRAGGDIRGSVAAGEANRPYVQSNNFILGGPGALIVEAGRNLGPFVTSAILRNLNGSSEGISYAGGIRAIGNEYNPWLGFEGADLGIRFGMAAGADYTVLRETYLNPANAARLDGDLFEQNVDSFGNRSPDRSRPIYAPILAAWLRETAPETFAALFGPGFANTSAGNAALTAAAYGRSADLYAAFAALDPFRQQAFLVDRLYFNELAAAADPNGVSYLQYIRGYRAVQTLFPSERGYTDNLAPYTLDPSTISADNPLGAPVRNVVNGQPQRAERVRTGSVDLRLSTIQTARGGDITILGPGGDVIAGSVVRTAEQAQRRNSAFSNIARVGDFVGPPYLESGNLTGTGGRTNGLISAIPQGFEGVLTLRGGQIRSFTDGDFRLNQSRVFTQSGGDITMWSSNGDLNAGQGPRSASNFPPITVRFDPNGLAEVNSAGSVSGAGIGAFKRFPTDPASDIILIAPVGEVDAGDAGVRASGNILVAAARVANADNFSAAGDISGVPTGAVTATVATPAEASSAIAAQLANVAGRNRGTENRRSLITVDVLGPAGGDRCDNPENANDPECRERDAGN